MKQKTNKKNRIHNYYFKKIMFIFLIIVVLNSCASDYFRLNFHTLDKRNIIEGRIFTNKDSLESLNVLNVNVINENTFEMFDDTKVALKYLHENEFQADFTIELIEGKSFILYLRTFFDDFKNQTKMRLTYNDLGVFLHEIRFGGEYLITENREEKLHNGEKKRFFIKNDGKRLKITIDCVDIVDVRTNLNISQYLIFETEKNSKLFVSGISFATIR